MTAELERAVSALAGHSVCLCGGGRTLTGDGRGVAPLIALIDSGADLSGMSAADIVVGKAAALLLAYAGVKEVYGKVMSDPAAEALAKLGIPASWGERTPYIINRRGDGMCPMEIAVSGTDDPSEALSAVRAALEKMKK